MTCQDVPTDVCVNNLQVIKSVMGHGLYMGDASRVCPVSVFLINFPCFSFGLLQQQPKGHSLIGQRSHRVRGGSMGCWAEDWERVARSSLIQLPIDRVVARNG